MCDGSRTDLREVSSDFSCLLGGSPFPLSLPLYPMQGTGEARGMGEDIHEKSFQVLGMSGVLFKGQRLFSNCHFSTYCCLSFLLLVFSTENFACTILVEWSRKQNEIYFH